MGNAVKGNIASFLREDYRREPLSLNAPPPPRIVSVLGLAPVLHSSDVDGMIYVGPFNLLQLRPQ